MRGQNNSMNTLMYIAPVCNLLSMDVEGVLAVSNIIGQILIQDPLWETNGDYGLE